MGHILYCLGAFGIGAASCYLMVSTQLKMKSAEEKAEIAALNAQVNETVQIQQAIEKMVVDGLQRRSQASS